jgi:predicted transcriptional regulator
MASRIGKSVLNVRKTMAFMVDRGVVIDNGLNGKAKKLELAK